MRRRKKGGKKGEKKKRGGTPARPPLAHRGLHGDIKDN